MPRRQPRIKKQKPRKRAHYRVFSRLLNLRKAFRKPSLPINIRIFSSTIVIGILGVGLLAAFFLLGQLQEKRNLEPKLIQAETELSKLREEVASKTSKIKGLSESLEQGKEENKTLESIRKAQEARAKRLAKIGGSLLEITIKQRDLIDLEQEMTVLFVQAKGCLDAYNLPCFDTVAVQLKVKLEQVDRLEKEIDGQWGKIQGELDFLRKAGIL